MRRITVSLLFGAIQTAIAFSAIVLAIVVNFNVFNVQTMLDISEGASKFYVAVLVVFGFAFAAGGLYLIYDWWESRWERREPR